MMKKCDYFKELILTGFIDGQLDKNTAGSVESHLLDCRDCRAFFKEVKHTVVEPIKQVPSKLVPVELWDAIKQGIEQENAVVSPWADLMNTLKGLISFPRMVPVFVSLVLMFLVVSVTLNRMQYQQAQDKDIGTYLVSMLSFKEEVAQTDSKDRATPIEHYFL